MRALNAASLPLRERCAVSGTEIAHSVPRYAVSSTEIGYQLCSARYGDRVKEACSRRGHLSLTTLHPGGGAEGASEAEATGAVAVGMTRGVPVGMGEGAVEEALEGGRGGPKR